MSEADPHLIWRHVAEWLRLAADDLRAVRLCLAADPPLSTIASYHCQQAVEKLLKGFLVVADVHFRKTHDLAELRHTVIAKFPAIAPLTEGVGAWSLWSVAHRYPGETGPEPEPDIQELLRAVDVIVQLQAALRALQPPKGGARDPQRSP